MEEQKTFIHLYRKLTVQNEQLISTICNFSWLGYLNARAPPGQVAVILVQIPLSLLLQKEVFPLVVHSSYMVVDPSD